MSGRKFGKLCGEIIYPMYKKMNWKNKILLYGIISSICFLYGEGQEILESLALGAMSYGGLYILIKAFWEQHLVKLNEEFATLDVHFMLLEAKYNANNATDKEIEELKELDNLKFHLRNKIDRIKG